jgi:O-acetyl-ADP-ribose deacetylase (regulator of RNase III)
MHKDWQPLGFVSSWGGMEVGSGMMYSSSVIDGLVHQFGGWKLEAECTVRRLAAMGDDPCPIGSAIQTSSGNDNLLQYYDTIIHTTPPFYKYDPNPQHSLFQCYINSFRLAFENNNNNNNNRPLRVAVPLIGSGARGFPYDEAIEIASSAAIKWATSYDDNDDNVDSKRANNDVQQSVQTTHTIVFGLLEDYLAEQLCSTIENKISQSSKLKS